MCLDLFLAASPSGDFRRNSEDCNWWCRNLIRSQGAVSFSVTLEELKGSKLFLCFTRFTTEDVKEKIKLYNSHHVPLLAMTNLLTSILTRPSPNPTLNSAHYHSLIQAYLKLWVQCKHTHITICLFVTTVISGNTTFACYYPRDFRFDASEPSKVSATDISQANMMMPLRPHQHISIDYS